MFCADRLSIEGKYDIHIFEAGKPIRQRDCPEFDCICKVCHVLEGEGGAGGFSDGKNTYSITRGTQMEDVFAAATEKWIDYIDEEMVRYGGKGVWYDPVDEIPESFEGSPFQFISYPLRHVGSDGIRDFVEGFSNKLQEKGVSLWFTEASLLFADDNSRVIGVEVPSTNVPLTFDHVVIAAGLQGIPWVERLMLAIGSPLSAGPAGFGLRLEMDADVMEWIHQRFYDYKIIYNHSSGITLRSFCCNSHGSVINERHTDLNIINVNGHSFLDPARRTKSSNMALIAKIPESFSRSPQGYVRDVARHINLAAGGSAFQPMSSFMGKPSWFDARARTNHQANHADIADILSQHDLLSPFQAYIEELNKIVPIIAPSSLVYGPEIKYYGRRVNVDENWRSRDIPNLSIIGSATGYLDSFVAAALSGIVAAENLKKE